MEPEINVSFHRDVESYPWEVLYSLRFRTEQSLDKLLLFGERVQ